MFLQKCSADYLPIAGGGPTLCPQDEISHCSYVVTLENGGVCGSVCNESCSGWIYWIFHPQLFREYVCVQSLWFFPLSSEGDATFFMYITIHCSSLILLGASLSFFPGFPAHLFARTGSDLWINEAIFKCVVSSMQFPSGKKPMSLVSEALTDEKLCCPYLSHLTALRLNFCAVLQHRMSEVECEMWFGPSSWFCRTGWTWAFTEHPDMHNILQVGCSEAPHLLPVKDLKVHPGGQLVARQCRQWVRTLPGMLMQDNVDVIVSVSVGQWSLICIHWLLDTVKGLQHSNLNNVGTAASPISKN